MRPDILAIELVKISVGTASGIDGYTVSLKALDVQRDSPTQLDIPSLSLHSAFMPRRNVSFVGQRAGLAKSFVAAIFPSEWRNYAVVVWSPKESLMLRLELHESWSEENFVWFKRVPRSPVSELERRKVGSTKWSDEAIVVQGIQIIARGPPYASERWHLFWPDHQTFVEELASTIVKNPPPYETPPRLLVYRGTDALKNWDRHGPPIAVQFKSGGEEISDEWTGGKGMLYAYPGGPGRIRKP